MASFLRILVVSDVHGDRRTLCRILDIHHTAHAVVFLGDGADNFTEACAEYPPIPVYAVSGNCDRSCNFPDEREFLVGGKRFFIAHGHTYGVKHSPLRFQLAAQSRGADVALFGHTHQPLLHSEEGFVLLNPGSVMSGSRYALVDITDQGIFPHLETIR